MIWSIQLGPQVLRPTVSPSGLGEQSRAEPQLQGDKQVNLDFMVLYKSEAPGGLRLRFILKLLLHLLRSFW